MGDEQESSPRPMANMLEAARGGQLSISMRPEEFIYLDRDCDYFKNTILQIQRIAEEISGHSVWGLGEANDDMVSARTMVGRFKVKAKGAPDQNDVYAIMEQHYRIVEGIQEAHRIVRDKLMETDSAFAATFTRLNTELPERPPAAPKPGPYLLPDGSTR